MKGTDKIFHFVVCLVIAFMAGVIAWQATDCNILAGVLCAVGTGMGAGLGKEWGDLAAKGNTWDWWDVLADALGVLLAVLIILGCHYGKG